MFLTINDIKEAASAMKSAIGVDYSSYSFSFFRRRLNMVLDKLNVHKIQEFYDMLADAQTKDQIAGMMMVSCTELFRDPAFWRAIKKLLAERPSLRIWFPTLSSPDELYSLLVLLDIMKISDCRIVVSCESQSVINEIKSLKISAKPDDLYRNNFDRLESGANYDDYFTENDGSLVLKAKLLDKVEFRKEWYMNAKPEHYDLIMFRNVLLTYGVHLHEQAVTRLYESLNDKGLLAIGIKEKLLAKIPQLAVANEPESIYGRGLK